MNRTGSIYSRVGPAVTMMRIELRSSYVQHLCLGMWFGDSLAIFTHSLQMHFDGSLYSLANGRPSLARGDTPWQIGNVGGVIMIRFFDNHQIVHGLYPFSPACFNMLL